MAEPPEPASALDIQGLEDKRDLIVLKIASKVEEVNTAIESLLEILHFVGTSKQIPDYAFSKDQWEFFAQLTAGLASAHDCLRRS